MDQDEARRLLAAMLAEKQDEDPGYSLSAFGRDLATMAGRTKPYARQYVFAVLKGSKGYPVSGELVDALQRLYAVRHDGLADFQASLRPAPDTVLTMHPLHEGSIIMGESRLCVTPGCGLWFVPSSPNRKFCPRCRPPRAPKKRT